MKELHHQDQNNHSYDFQLMLRDIDRREKAAEKWGDGQKDIVVSLFLRSLDRTRLPRGSWAQKVYQLRQAGRSSEEAAAVLEISVSEVWAAERYLLSLYGRACLRTGNRRPRFEGTYRLYRRDTTGAVDYRLLSRDGSIGLAHCPVIPGFPVILQRNALMFNCSSPPEQRSLPGVSRVIFDADSGSEYSAITYLGTNTHALRLNWDTDKRTFRIQKATTGTYRISLDGELYGELFPSEKAPYLSDWQLRYEMHIYQPVSEDLAFLLLSFPLLQLS